MELRGSVRVGSVEDQAIREHQGHGVERAIGILGHAAAHAAGVVCHDPAHHAGVDGGGVRSNAAAVSFEDIIYESTNDPRLEAN